MKATSIGETSYDSPVSYSSALRNAYCGLISVTFWSNVTSISIFLFRQMTSLGVSKPNSLEALWRCGLVTQLKE